MKTRTHVSRRTFLKLTGALSALFLIPKIMVPDPLKNYAGETLLGGHLKKLFKNRESAAAVGEAYLAAFPKEASAGKLIGALETENGWQPLELASTGKRKFNQLVKRSVTDDFRAGKTVLLDGWMLARTEARLCALVSLSRFSPL